SHGVFLLLVDAKIMRALFSLPFLLLLLAFSNTSQAFNVAKNCPHGIRNPMHHKAYGSQDLCNSQFPKHSAALSPNTAAYYCESGNGYTISHANCANQNTDDSGEDGCYPGDTDPLTGYCPAPNGHQECQGAGGQTYTLE